MLITIGAFDGFHRGHKELLDICRRNSSNNDWGVISFYPHPSEYINGPKHHSLFTLSERELLRRVIGIPNMYVLKFDEALMNLKPSEFWRLIRDRFNVDGLVMGSDFHFGHERSGSAYSLRELAETDGIKNIIIADLKDKNRYSSSNIRHKILEGSIDSANDILGYNWFIMSDVIHGNERGRTMNFPTANINLSGGRIIPAYGVYSAVVLVNHEWHCGALSIGNNPTFNDVNETRAEVHILDYSGNLYGDDVLMFFLGRVRDIIAFRDKRALMDQINSDIVTSRRIYGEVMKRQSTLEFLEGAEKVYYSEQNLNPEIIRLI